MSISISPAVVSMEEMIQGISLQMNAPSYRVLSSLTNKPESGQAAEGSGPQIASRLRLIISSSVVTFGTVILESYRCNCIFIW